MLLFITHAFFVSSVVLTGVFVLVSVGLERWRPMLSRRDPERMIMILGHLRNPVLVRTLSVCSPIRILVFALSFSGWILLWAWRGNERRLTFPSPDTREVISFLANIPLLIAWIGWVNCDSSHMIAAFACIGAWVCTIFVAYKQEATVPKQFRERDLVLILGIYVLVETTINWKLTEDGAIIASSVAQVMIAFTLLLSQLKTGNPTEFYETVCELRGEIRSAAEFVHTPHDQRFMNFCERLDEPAANDCVDARDKEKGAILSDAGTISWRKATARLEKYWPAFVKEQDRDPYTRVVRYPEESDDTSEIADDDDDDDQEEK